MVTRTLAAPLLLLATACVQDPVIPKIPEQLVPLHIAASVSELRAGQAAVISVIAINPFEEAVELFFSTSCQVLVYIRNASGRVVVPEKGSYSCATVPSRLVIPASDSVMFTFDWRGGSEFVPPGSTARLPPGAYYVSAIMESEGYVAYAFPVLLTVID